MYMIKRTIVGALFILFGALSGIEVFARIPFDIKEVLIRFLGYSIPLLVIGIILLKHRKDTLFFSERKSFKIGFGILLMIVTFYTSHVMAIAECAGSKRCISSSGYPIPILTMGSDVGPGLVDGIVIPIIGLVLNYIFHFVLACAIIRIRTKQPTVVSNETPHVV